MKKRAMQHLKTIEDENGTRRVEFSALNVRVTESLMRAVRRQAALEGKTLSDFVREAIEERFRGTGLTSSMRVAARRPPVSRTA